MAQVSFPDSLYKVTMTEYEDGVQRPMGTRFFTSKEEAVQYCKEYDGGSYECYYRATYEKIS